MVEVAGIEPASQMVSNMASTRLAGLFGFKWKLGSGTLSTDLRFTVGFWKRGQRYEGSPAI